MKTHAQQTGKWNGTSSLVVLGILFLTVLPLNNVVAGSIEKSDTNSLMEPDLPIESWMLRLIQWNTEQLVAEVNNVLIVEDWMLTSENWDNHLQTGLSEAPEADHKSLDDWMFEPADWRSDFARLGQDDADLDLVILPLYF